MSKRISVHTSEEYHAILNGLDIRATFEFNSSIFVVGEHHEFGSVVGISNIEECFIISG